ncbi:hypothetical protein HXX02_00235 [Microbulbifer elongatus]|uniref:Uncharacterized protein n=1 Tax=Microbulbifer elongatus TaxID=86173 RepID=A0ABT1NVD9_9GAMM|nr:hypothetical protein [Microbulbifer elongatus]MCQ3827863.1 hypothetical protein [Microbulbifer elongatus]
MNQEVEDIRDLSLTARLILALINFEKFCLENDLQSKSVSDLIAFLWKWPLIDGPDEFEPWIESAPALLHVALGNDLPHELKELLDERNIEEQRFRNIVEGLVEIIWGSFWGASEDLVSLEAFHKSFKSSRVEQLPPLTPFKFSRFRDNDGWGVKPSSSDVAYWSSIRPHA